MTIDARLFMIVCWALLGHARASNGTNPSALDTLHDIYDNCLQHFDFGCAKPRALRWISEIAGDKNIRISEDLVIIKKDGNEVGNEQERGLENDIFEKFEDFLQSHYLIVRPPQLLSRNGPLGSLVPRSLELEDIRVPLADSGRSSKTVKRVILPFLLGLKFKTAVLVPLALALIALKTWKALTLGLLSLVMTGALVIFKLTKPKVVNYEVIHYPQHVEHHVDHPSPSSGWDHPGYGRQMTGSEMAYKAHRK